MPGKHVRIVSVLSKKKKKSKSRSRAGSRGSKGSNRPKSKRSKSAGSKKSVKVPEAGAGGNGSSPSDSSDSGSSSDTDSSSRSPSPGPSSKPPVPPPMPPGPVQRFQPPSGTLKGQIMRGANERGVWDPDHKAHLATVKFPASKKYFKQQTIKGVTYPTQQAVARPDPMRIGIQHTPVYEGPIELRAAKTRVYVRTESDPNNFTEIIVPSEKYMYWPHVRPGQHVDAKYLTVTDRNLHGLDRVKRMPQYKPPVIPETERDAIAHRAGTFEKNPKKWAGFETRTTPSGSKKSLAPVRVPPNITEDKEDSDTSSGSSSSPSDPSSSKSPEYELPAFLRGPTGPVDEPPRSKHTHLKVQRVDQPMEPMVKPTSIQRQGEPMYGPFRRSNSFGALGGVEPRSRSQSDPGQRPPSFDDLPAPVEQHFGQPKSQPAQKEEQESPKGARKIFQKILRRTGSDPNMAPANRGGSSSGSGSTSSGSGSGGTTSGSGSGGTASGSGSASGSSSAKSEEPQKKKSFFSRLRRRTE